jgi:threonine dehydrogenase-like Zn-dependent dehydrogenase
MAQKKLGVEPLVSKVILLEEIDKAFEELLDKPELIKVQVKP